MTKRQLFAPLSLFCRNKPALFSSFFIVLLIISSVLSFFMLDFERDVVAFSLQILSPPSSAHLFGTDHLGRDVLNRVFYGAAYSLSIGIACATVGMLLGTFFGCVAAFGSKAVANALMRINEMLYSIPNILIAAVVASLLGSSFLSLMLSLSVSPTIAFTRTVRTQVMKIKGLAYVQAAEAMGQSKLSTIVRHILPNCMSHIAVQLMVSVGVAIISASSLSFLGIGAPLPYPEWGAMLSDARGYVRSAFWTSFFPGLFIMLTVLAFNLIADGMQDAFDIKGQPKSYGLQ